LNGTEVLAATLYYLNKYFTFQSAVYMGTSKNSFLLRTAAISSVGVVRPKCVLDIALAMPAAILTFRLDGENFARSRNESSFETASNYFNSF
jgi:hypothetical protein